MPELEWVLALRLGAALAFGFLIGLERERSKDDSDALLPAGARTFSLLSLFGFSCGWLHEYGVTLAIPVGLLAVTALSVSGYWVKSSKGQHGFTTEAAQLLTFGIGALVLLTEIWLPLALTVVAAILLSEKALIVQRVHLMERQDYIAVLRFLLVAFIILPALPNQPYTPFRLNPYTIWVVVVAVSSLGFGAYLLCKHLGDRAGLRLSGLLGGIVSSTAVSVAMGRHARKHPDTGRAGLQAALLGNAMLYPRLLIVAGLIQPAMWGVLLPHMAGLCAIALILSATERVPAIRSAAPESPAENPFELQPALILALLFVVMTILTELAHDWFGAEGVLGLAVLVGLTDITPFVLALARDAANVETLAIVAMLVAMMSNTIVKACYFAYFARSLHRETAMRFGLLAAAHLPFIFWIVATAHS